MAIYACVLNAQRNGLVMLKADDTDPLDTEWTQQDGVSFQYPMNQEIKSVGMKYDDNDAVIRITAVNEGDGTSQNLHYHEFQPSSDTWVVRGERITFPTSPDFYSCDVSYRIETGDNDKVAVARIGAGTVQMYSDTGSGWIQRSSMSTTSEGGCAIALPDSSSRTMVAYSDSSVADVLARNSLTGDTLGSEATPDADCDTADSVISNIVVDSSGIAYFAYIDADNILSLADAQTAADSPTWTTVTGIGDSTVYGHGRTAAPYAAFFLAVKTDELHLIYVDDTDKDIQHNADTGSGWGTDTEVQAGTGDIARVSGSYFATQDKIGILYDDAGTTKFVYHDLSAAVEDVPVPLSGKFTNTLLRM